MPKLRRNLLIVGTAVAFGFSAFGNALAYKPESPEVQVMVNKAIEHLEDGADGKFAGYNARTGGICLIALAIFKHNGDIDHPIVQAAVAKCKKVAAAGVSWSTESNYSVGIAIIFLAEIDPGLYKPEIEVLLGELLNRQQKGGAWSYQAHKTGDTSQTQYAVLGCWMAHRQNIPVPQDAVERVCNWLIRTQAPAGSWGYQGKDVGGYERQVQDKETHSLAAAGLGSTYVAAELLGFIQGPDDRPNKSGKPAALREVSTETKKRGGPVTDVVPSAMLQRTIRDGNGWFARNFSIENRVGYQHYYMYALERYMSFREFSEHSSDDEPSWYNQGVEYLQRTQAENGSFTSSEAGDKVDTAFAVLFLLRSTKKSIRRIVEESGRLRGGKILPADLSTITVDAKGQVVDTKATPAIETLLAMLEDEDAPGNALNSSIPAQLELSKDPKVRTAQLDRLRRLAMNGSYQARLTAVKTLGHDRDLDNVPALIFALSDPDQRVIRAARDGLRFISRKIDGFGMTAEPTRAEWKRAQDEWKTWYRSIRPEGALIE